MVGRSCRTRGPSGGLTAAAERGAPPAPAFESLSDRADAPHVVNDALVITNRNRINTWALARLPTMHGLRTSLKRVPDLCEPTSQTCLGALPTMWTRF